MPPALLSAAGRARPARPSRRRDAGTTGTIVVAVPVYRPSRLGPASASLALASRPAGRAHSPPCLVALRRCGVASLDWKARPCRPCRPCAAFAAFALPPRCSQAGSRCSLASRLESSRGQSAQSAQNSFAFIRMHLDVIPGPLNKCIGVHWDLISDALKHFQ